MHCGHAILGSSADRACIAVPQLAAWLNCCCCMHSSSLQRGLKAGVVYTLRNVIPKNPPKDRQDGRRVVDLHVRPGRAGLCLVGRLCSQHNVFCVGMQGRAGALHLPVLCCSV